jgi:hypothetical protein
MYVEHILLVIVDLSKLVIIKKEYLLLRKGVEVQERNLIRL